MEGEEGSGTKANCTNITDRAKWVERKDERVSIGHALCVGLLFNNLKRDIALLCVV